MQVTYHSKKLEKLCTDKKEMVKQLGSFCAEKLEQRMFDLLSAETLAVLFLFPRPRCHMLIGNRKEQFSVDLTHPLRLIFQVTNDPVPRFADTGIDLSAVTEIEIIEITDTH